MFIQILLQIVLIFCNAVFACAEIAVISISDAKLDRLSAGGSKPAKRLKSLTSQPAKFLATIQVAITLSGFIGSAFAADNFSEPLTDLVMKTGVHVSASVIKSVSVIAITLILSYFTLVFGELVPKRLAMKKSEQLALGMSGMIYVISKLFAPIVWLLNVSTNGILRLMGINPEDADDGITEEEILIMSDAGAEKGTIDADDNEIIKNIFAFDDLSVEQICTHRTDVVFLMTEQSDEEWQQIIHNGRHSFFPICSKKVDKIVGILNVGEYFRLERKDREAVMKNAVHEPFFVHECMKADVLFEKMKKHDAAHFAVVIDEYGGISGIITITDLIEQIIGDFSEKQPDEPHREIHRTADNEWSATGIVALSDVAEKIGISLPTDRFDTLGGYLMSFSPTFPKDEAAVHIETDVLTADIEQIRNHRVEKCLLKIKQTPPST